MLYSVWVTCDAEGKVLVLGPLKPEWPYSENHSCPPGTTPVRLGHGQGASDLVLMHLDIFLGTWCRPGSPFLHAWKEGKVGVHPFISLAPPLLLPPLYFLNKLRIFIIHHLADRWVLLENIRKCLKSHIYANGMPRPAGGVPEFLICLGQCGK